MHYVSENFIHRRNTPPPRRSSLVPVATRDDLVRLVVGMQWQTAIALMAYDAVVDVEGASLHRDAGDIVDEWLGVR